jgi:S-layer family protein
MKPTQLLVIAAACLLGVPPPARGEGSSSRTYGTSQESLQRIGTLQFAPFGDCHFDGPPINTFRCYGGGGGATPSLPSGALVTGVMFDVCDSSASQDIIVFAWSVDNLGENLQLLGSAATSGTPGCAGVFVDVSASNFVVDNAGAGNQLALLMGLNSGDDTQSFAGATIHYKLQVSPAPATATFGDVPTSSQQFRFVEALAAAGITAGCGGGNFCPNQPITRGQMAVFLAAALGLHWP